MSQFNATLDSGRVLLMDGAMGTELQRAGLRDGECGEAWNLVHPDRVYAIHRAYVEAGTECLLTNTFQSNTTSLERHGLTDRLEAINAAAIELCRSAAGPKRFVIGDIGPIGGDQSALALRRIVKSLHGVDALLLETASDLCELSTLCASVDEKVPVMFTMTCHGNYCLWTGKSLLQELSDAHHEYDVAAVGLNCGRDIDLKTIAPFLRTLREAGRCPLILRPNAGTPHRVEDHWVYPYSPSDMASCLPEWLGAGVKMIGGCCGTTPEHIAAFRPIVQAWNAGR